MTQYEGSDNEPAVDSAAVGSWHDESEFAVVDAAFDTQSDTESGMGVDNDVDNDADGAPARPVLAVVRRPNVGKSTLVNRLLGRSWAVVQDVTGVTRDGIGYEAVWSGRLVTVIDTGGWDTGAGGLQAAVTSQAEQAMDSADVVLLVVDGQVGATETEEAAA